MPEPTYPSHIQWTHTYTGADLAAWVAADVLRQAADPPPPVDIWADPTADDPPDAPCWPGCPVCTDEGPPDDED